MSLTILSGPGTFEFCNSKIVLSLQCDVDTAVELTLSANGSDLIKTKYTPDSAKRILIDISEVLRSIATSSVLADSTTLVPLIGTPAKYSYKVVGVPSGTTLNSGDKYILWGGVSKFLQRSLISNALNIFTYRLTNPSRQFLFTTRTNGRHLVMRETEMTPLLFIHPGTTIQFVSDRARVVLTSAGQSNRLYAMNIAAIRKHFYTVYNETVSYFSVKINDNYLFDVSITPSLSSGNVATLLFRNSLGCYEKIEVTGSRTITLETDDEASETKTFDESVFDYVAAQIKKNVKAPILVNVGYKNDEEFSFLQDLLCSDDVYLIADGKTLKVVVALDDVKRSTANPNVNTATIILNPIESDNNFAPDIDMRAPGDGLGSWIIQDDELNAFGFLYQNYTL